MKKYQICMANEEISNLYGEKFLNNLKDNQFQAKMFLIKAGESYKNLKTLSRPKCSLSRLENHIKT